MYYQSFSDAYLDKYNGKDTHILQLVASALAIAPAGTDLLPVIPWASIDRQGLKAIKAYICQKEGICTNSAAQYIAKIKSVILEARADGVAIPADASKLLTVRQLRSHGVYIDTDRLHSLENLQIPSTRADKAKSMRIAQLLALISGRTGARASDVVRLTPSNIRNGLLTYVPRKTKESSGKVCVVPVGPKTTRWIAEVTELAKDIDTSTEKAEKAFYVRYERSLKDICQLMPWDEEVVVFEANEEKVKIFRDCITSHTLRHSFATNMYLDDEVGGDIYAISQMLGHSSVDMTMSYICVPFNEKKMAKVKYFE